VRTVEEQIRFNLRAHMMLGATGLLALVALFGITFSW
jgi:hypothetical protein